MAHTRKYHAFTLRLETYRSLWCLSPDPWTKEAVSFQNCVCQWNYLWLLLTYVIQIFILLLIRCSTFHFGDFSWWKSQDVHASKQKNVLNPSNFSTLKPNTWDFRIRVAPSPRLAMSTLFCEATHQITEVRSRECQQEGNPTGAVCFFGSHENGPGWIFFKSKPCDFFSDMIEHLNKVLKPSPPFPQLLCTRFRGWVTTPEKKNKKILALSCQPFHLSLSFQISSHKFQVKPCVHEFSLKKITHFCFLYPTGFPQQYICFRGQHLWGQTNGSQLQRCQREQETLPKPPKPPPPKKKGEEIEFYSIFFEDWKQVVWRRLF